MLGTGALWLQDVVDPRLRAGAGIVAFLAVAGACSAQLRAVNLRLVVSGLALQVGLAVVILKVEIAGVRPGHQFFGALAAVATQFLEFYQCRVAVRVRGACRPRRDGRAVS